MCLRDKRELSAPGGAPSSAPSGCGLRGGLPVSLWDWRLPWAVQIPEGGPVVCSVMALHLSVILLLVVPSLPALPNPAENGSSAAPGARCQLGRGWGGSCPSAHSSPCAPGCRGPWAHLTGCDPERGAGFHEARGASAIRVKTCDQGPQGTLGFGDSLGLTELRRVVTLMGTVYHRKGYRLKSAEVKGTYNRGQRHQAPVSAPVPVEFVDSTCSSQQYCRCTEGVLRPGSSRTVMRAWSAAVTGLADRPTAPAQIPLLAQAIWGGPRPPGKQRHSYRAGYSRA